MKSKQAFYSVLGNFVYLLAVWALTVVVVSRRDGVIQVTQVVIGTSRRIEIGQGNGGVDD